MVLVYRLLSVNVKNRFPSLQTLVDANLMLPHEVKRLKIVGNKTPHDSTWTPILWAMKVLSKARQEGKIKMEAPVFASMNSCFEELQDTNRKILNYGWMNFPLAYTQVFKNQMFENGFYK